MSLDLAHGKRTIPKTKNFGVDFTGIIINHKFINLLSSQFSVVSFCCLFLKLLPLLEKLGVWERNAINPL